MRILCNAKDSHILSTKNNNVFVIFMFEILTNDIINSLFLNLFQPTVLEVKNESFMHKVPKGMTLLCHHSSNKLGPVV